MKSFSILLADEDNDDSILFKEIIEDFSFSANLTLVDNGEKLMQILRKSNKLPDILFLVLNMPRKNGFECLMEIKNDEQLKKNPVIVFSTSFQDNIVNLLYENGAHFYIRKPGEYSILKNVILSSLNHPVLQNKEEQPLREFFVLNSI